MLENGAIDNDAEKEKLEYLLKAKKWNPYCLRHSAITNDSDYLPEFAVKKKARWSMNNRQGARYIKSRMGADLKRTILEKNGITVEEDEALKHKPAIRDCPRCNLVNTFENKYCSKCSYPLTPQAYEEIKASEDMKLKAVEDRYQREMMAMRVDMRIEMKNQISQLITKLKPKIIREGLA